MSLTGSKIAAHAGLFKVAINVPRRSSNSFVVCVIKLNCIIVVYLRFQKLFSFSQNFFSTFLMKISSSIISSNFENRYPKINEHALIMNMTFILALLKVYSICCILLIPSQENQSHVCKFQSILDRKSTRLNSSH